MNGTTTFELDPQLDLEMDFSFTPGRLGRLTADPDSSYPDEGPLYEIEEIRVCHNKKWHKVPQWLCEILNFNYEKDLVEVVDQWLDQP